MQFVHESIVIMNSSTYYIFENIFISSSDLKYRFLGIKFLADSFLKQSTGNILDIAFDNDLHITLETQAKAGK